MDNRGFELIKEALKRFADDQSGNEVGKRLARTLGAGGKAAAERLDHEFPADFVKDMVKSFYSLLTSQEVSDGISMSIRVYDEEMVSELLNQVVSRLKDDAVASQAAKFMKDLLAKASDEQIMTLFEAAIRNRSMAEQVVLRHVFETQVKPVLEEMRDLPEDQIAEKLKELADNIPVDLIAMQAAALTREITPERVAKSAHDMVGKLPSPNAIADVFNGVSKLAASKFDKMSQVSSLDDARNLMRELGAESAQLVQKTLSNDNAAKAKPDKGKKQGGRFKFGK